jgi:hypothetical protein
MKKSIPWLHNSNLLHKWHMPSCKSCLRLLIIPLLFIAVNTFSQVAPVVVPNGGFHIDGNLKANIPAAGIGDWINGAGGAGGYVINDNGSVINSATTFNLSDPYNTSSDIIFSGGSKVNDDPVDWTWSTQSPPPKNDINRGLIHIGKDINENVWLMMSGDRLSTNGDSYIDFELLQNTMTRNTGNNHFNTAGPDGGRTVNDILLTVEYSNGGGVSNIIYYRWLPDGSGGFEYQEIPNLGPNGFAVTNSAAVDIPFGGFGNTTYSPLQFVEAAVNLTQVIHLSSNLCQGMDIKTLFIKTKASTSPTAELKDFIEPLQLELLLDEVTLAAVNPLCINSGAVVLSGAPSGGSFSGPGVSGNTFNPAVAGPGLHTIVYAKELKPGCTRTATITIQVDPASSGGAVSGGVTVCSGSNSGTLTLSGQVGTVLKWQSSVDGGASWTDIANTTASQGYSNLTQNTLFRAVVQSGVCASANAAPAGIVVDPVSVGGAVSGGATVCSGSNSGTLTLSGQVGTVLKWQSSVDGGASWTDIANTTASQGYTNLTQNTLFRAVVQSGVCASANATPAGIVVDPVSVGGVVSGGATVCSGSNSGTLTLSGQVGTVLKWQSSVDGGASWTDIANTTASQGYTNLTQNTLFRAVVQSGVCASANAAPAGIVVDPVSVGGVVSGGATVCSGSNSGTLTLSGQVGTVLKWQSSVDGGASWIDIVNTTASQGYSNLTQNTLFRAVVQSGVCASANAAPATIVVNPPSVGGAVSGGATVCSGSNSGTLTLSGQVGTVLKWQSSVDGGASWTDIVNTTASQGYSNLTQNTLFRAVVQSGVCVSANAVPAAIAINTAPVGGNVNNTIVCNSNAFGSVVLTGYSGTIIMWQSSVDGGASWNDMSNTDDTLNFGPIAQTTQYRAVVQNGVCPLAYSGSGTALVISCQTGNHCTYTQGFYGNLGGLGCSGGNSGGNTMENSKFKMLRAFDLYGQSKVVFGKANIGGILSQDRAFTLFRMDVSNNNIYQMLPGGGTPNALGVKPGGVTYSSTYEGATYSVTNTWNAVPIAANGSTAGKIKNSLLAQTMALFFNMYNGTNLASFGLHDTLYVTSFDCLTGNPIPNAPILKFGLPHNVLQYIASQSGTYSYNIAGLYALANDKLGGMATGGISASEITNAVDIINNAFDGCRSMVGYYDIPGIAARNDMNLNITRVWNDNQGLKALVYPNPYADVIRFKIESQETGTCVIELYNMLGQKVHTLYPGSITAERSLQVEYIVPAGEQMNFMYIIRVGKQQVSGKLINISR